MAVADEYGTGWRLLGSEDASFMPYRQPAVEALKGLDGRPSYAGAFRPWQHPEGVQLEPHRVVPSHPPAVFEAQDLFQAQLRVQRPECRLRVLRRNLETPVVSRQELLQHPVGFSDAAGTSQAEFSYQPILKGSCRSLHSPFCLGRLGKNHLYPQLVHGPAELGRHPREAGARRVPEDGVAVGVEGDGYAEMLHETLDQQEVVATVFLTAEEGGNYRSGGIIHRDQQRERRRLISQPRVVTAIHLDQHSLPGHTLAAHPMLGRTPLPRAAQTGVDQDAPQGGPANVYAFPFREQLGKMGMVSASVPGPGQMHYVGDHRLGRGIDR